MSMSFGNAFGLAKKPLGYLVIVVGLVGIIFIFSFFSKTATIITAPNTGLSISGVELPEKLDFAGEKVPLDYFDVKESLEKELLINSYWHSQTLLLIKRSTRFFGTIEPILKKNNIPDDFKYLALAESGFQNVTSSAGAVGFWQFIPATAKDYGLEVNAEVDERYNLEKATEAACKFLSESQSIYKSWTLAAAAYNLGRKNLNSQIERQYTENYYDILLNDETARYVFRILALKMILTAPDKYGFHLTKDEYYQPIPCKTVEVSTPVTDWAKFAFSEGTNYKMLKLLNPWLRDNFLTNKEGKKYLVKIPQQGFRTFSKVTDNGEIDRIVKQSEEKPQ
jgi:hypothetical protein